MKQLCHEFVKKSTAQAEKLEIFKPLFIGNLGILFGLDIEKEPMKCEFLTPSLALWFDFSCYFSLFNKLVFNN